MMRSAMPPTPPDVFRALSEPMRWAIVNELARVDELACLALETALPIARTTITYHISVLIHASLIEVRKHGRQYFYALRRDTLDSVLGEVADRARAFA